MYVENRGYPGGPWQYFLNTQNAAINVICYVSLCIATSMCDILVVSIHKFCLREQTRSSRTQLWRCWVIWTALDHRLAYLVILVPAIMLLSSFGTYLNRFLQLYPSPHTTEEAD